MNLFKYQYLTLVKLTLFIFFYINKIYYIYFIPEKTLFTASSLFSLINDA